MCQVNNNNRGGKYNLHNQQWCTYKMANRYYNSARFLTNNSKGINNSISMEDNHVNRGMADIMDMEEGMVWEVWGIWASWDILKLSTV